PCRALATARRARARGDLAPRRRRTALAARQFRRDGACSRDAAGGPHPLSRQRGFPHPAAAALGAPHPGHAVVRPFDRAEPPRATYRLQLNRDQTFADAAAIVDYLAALGISHLYGSPFLKARPGSPHGYDIIDHNALNPEIGDRGDLATLVDRL